jgi:hypothetical protein
MTFTTTISGALGLAETRQIAFVKNSQNLHGTNDFDSRSVVDPILPLYFPLVHGKRPGHWLQAKSWTA